MSEDPTRRGKIARLPVPLREELNLRLLNNVSGPRILAWLNSLPAVVEILEQEGEEQITPQNLSVWRDGGYADWLRRRERVENLKSLSSYAYQLAQAGGSLSDGAAAIAGGKILEMLENLDEENIGKLTASLAALRSSEASALNAKTNSARLAQKDRQLDLDEKKFQRGTAALFIKWARQPEAQAILGSGDTQTVQMDKLVQLFFGTAPEMQAREGE